MKLRVFHRSSLTTVSEIFTATWLQHPNSPIAAHNALMDRYVDGTGAYYSYLAGAGNPSTNELSITDGSQNLSGLFLRGASSILPFKIDRVVHRVYYAASNGSGSNLLLSPYFAYTGTGLTPPKGPLIPDVTTRMVLGDLPLTGANIALESNAGLSNNGDVSNSKLYFKEGRAFRQGYLSTVVEAAPLQSPYSGGITRNVGAPELAWYVATGVLNASTLLADLVIESQYFIDVDDIAFSQAGVVYAMFGTVFPSNVGGAPASNLSIREWVDGNSLVSQLGATLSNYADANVQCLAVRITNNLAAGFVEGTNLETGIQAIGLPLIDIAGNSTPTAFNMQQQLGVSFTQNATPATQSF